jgi:hypothetical protein
VEIRGILKLRNEVLLSWRDREHLTQAQAAAYAGVGVEAYARLERLDFCGMDCARVVPMVAEAVGCDPVDIVPPELRGRALPNMFVSVRTMSPDRLLEMSERKVPPALMNSDNLKEIAAGLVDVANTVLPRVPTSQREAFCMYYGWPPERRKRTYEEVGKLMNGMNRGTVRLKVIGATARIIRSPEMRAFYRTRMDGWEFPRPDWAELAGMAREMLPDRDGADKQLEGTEAASCGSSPSPAKATRT